MKLQVKLHDDLAKLALERNNPTKELLKVIIAEISRYSTKDVPDEEVLRIIKKMKANAIECGNLNEIPILDKYLPQMMSEDELRIYLSSLIDKGMTNIGKIMQHIRQSEFASIIDNGMASKISKELLRI